MIGQYNQIGQMMITKHSAHANDPSIWGKEVTEYYNTLELRGVFYHREIFKTTAILPMSINTQSLDNVLRYQVVGISDPIIIESVQIFNTLKGKNVLKHRVEVGAGIKFPLGATDLTYEEGTPNLDLQPGTGSWDGILTATYLMKYKKSLGWFTNVNYKLNSANQVDYKYGNALNVTSSFFYQTQGEKVKWMPTAGGYVEMAAQDQDLGLLQDESGGNIWFATAGFKVFWKSFNLTTDFQKVVKSNLNGYRQLYTRYKLNVGLTYSF